MTDETGAGQVRVLVVDDNESMRAVLRTVLRREGYDMVGELVSGDLLLPTVARCRPDIVCLDQNLPGVHGLELLVALRTAHPDLAVVMVTAAQDPLIEQQAVAAGAAGFLRKPFTPAQLVAALAAVAQAQRALQRVRGGSASGASPASAAGEAPAMRVVLADDSATMRALLRAILQGMGLSVVGEATEGAAALALVRELAPELVCLDVEMPKMGGLEALKEIRASHPGVRVVMVSSHAEGGIVREAIRNGAAGYILKPFDPAKVEATLRRLLA